MWCMADDWGVGDANPKTLAAGAFPNDEQWTSKELPSLCKEVADNYEVVFFNHRGRQYYQILSWDLHQVTQRRAKRRYPTHDDPESTPDLGVYELPSVCKEVPSVCKEVPCKDKENASTEQGNRGTGEQGNKEQGKRFVQVPSELSQTVSEIDENFRPDVEHLCTLLADLIESNGSKRPTITQRWRNAARLLIDKDGYTSEQVTWMIKWTQSNEFWRANILSMPKLREKFDQLKLTAQRDAHTKQAKRPVTIASQAQAIAQYTETGDP